MAWVLKMLLLKNAAVANVPNTMMFFAVLIAMVRALPEGFIQTVEAEVNERFARIEAIAYNKDPAQGGKSWAWAEGVFYPVTFMITWKNVRPKPSAEH